MSFKGTAGSFKMLNGPFKIAPKSGFSSLRYWVYQLRFTLSRRRFVSRLPILDLSTPVAVLPGNFRNLSRSTGLCAVGRQVGVQKGCVTQFIIGIIANILGHVAIEILESRNVGRISSVG